MDMPAAISRHMRWIDPVSFLFSWLALTTQRTMQVRIFTPLGLPEGKEWIPTAPNQPYSPPWTVGYGGLPAPKGAVLEL